jgi:hypothetical protein
MAEFFLIIQLSVVDQLGLQDGEPYDRELQIKYWEPDDDDGP